MNLNHNQREQEMERHYDNPRDDFWANARLTDEEREARRQRHQERWERQQEQQERQRQMAQCTTMEVLAAMFEQ